MENRDWLVFTEICDYEGERWNFFFPKTENNIECFAQLESLFQDVDENGDLASFSEVMGISVNAIKQLPEQTGYLGEFNIVDSELDGSKIKKIKAKDFEDDENPFYKGGIELFVK